MDFENGEIVGTEDTEWGKLLENTQKLRDGKYQWIFRALGAWDGTVEKAKIPSSFDDACERSVPPRP